jgi:hypothetical protein
MERRNFIKTCLFAPWLGMLKKKRLSVVEIPKIVIYKGNFSYQGYSFDISPYPSSASYRSFYVNPRVSSVTLEEGNYALVCHIVETEEFVKNDKFRKLVLDGMINTTERIKNG